MLCLMLLISDRLVENELLASSGAYSYGMARARKEMSCKFICNLLMQIVSQIVLAGDSTLILSAFEPHYIGPYTLKIESSLAFDLRPIPQEGAGMYERVIRGAWYGTWTIQLLSCISDLVFRTGDSAGGGPTSERYSKNPIFEIDIPVLTQFK